MGTSNAQSIHGIIVQDILAPANGPAVFVGANTAGDLVAVGTPGTAAFNPAWYAVTDIYWDPANLTGFASDANTGTSAGAGGPLLTFREIVRRYGSNRPQMNPAQNVTVHKLSGQPNDSDPVFFWPQCSGGGFCALLDTLVVFTGPSSSNVVTLLNKGAGTDLTVSGIAGVAVGMVVHNNTSGSYAYVKSVAAGVATMTQPVPDANVNTIGIPSGALGTNWVSGDSLTTYNLPNALYLKAWEVAGGDVNGSAACVGWVQFSQIIDVGTTTSELAVINRCASTVFSCCFFGTRVHCSTLAGRGDGIFFLNCFFDNAVVVYASECEIYSGYMASTLAQQGIGVLLDGNLIIAGTTTASGLTEFGSVHVAGALNLLAGFVRINAGGTVWGAGLITVETASTFSIRSGNTFAASLLTTGGFNLNLNSTGSYFTPGTGLWTSAVALTAANMDTNNGLQDPQSGARFSIGP